VLKNISKLLECEHFVPRDLTFVAKEEEEIKQPTQ
jgi:hypothetical protein